MVGLLKLPGEILGWALERIFFMKLNCVFSLGDGSRVGLWEDPWCGENPLCDIFPTLGQSS